MSVACPLRGPTFCNRNLHVSQSSLIGLLNVRCAEVILVILCHGVSGSAGASFLVSSCQYTPCAFLSSLVSVCFVITLKISAVHVLLYALLGWSGNLFYGLCSSLPDE